MSYSIYSGVRGSCHELIFFWLGPGKFQFQIVKLAPNQKDFGTLTHIDFYGRMGLGSGGHGPLNKISPKQ